MTRVVKIAYQGWPNCCHLSDEPVELIITTEVSPRFICLGFPEVTRVRS